MKFLKDSLVKLLFIFPMLAILVATTGILSYTSSLKKEVKSSANYSIGKKDNSNSFSIIPSNDSNSFLLKESEHLEFDFEIIWNSTFSFTHHFLEVTEKFYNYYDIRSEYINTVLDRVAERFPEEDIQVLGEILSVMSNELMPEITLIMENLKSKSIK